MHRILKTLRPFRFGGKYSWATNILTGSVLFVAGDAVQQKIEQKSGDLKSFDLSRLARSFTIGLIEGPPHVIFYSYLDHYYPSKNLITSLKKVLADQLIACPFFNIQYLVGMGYMEGKSWKEISVEFKKKFPTLVVVDWVFWPPVQLLNFLYVPGKYRIVYINSATVVWNIYLSYMKHYDQQNK